LRNQDKIPEIGEIVGEELLRRSSVGARMPDLEKYLYDVVVEHQRGGVGISGPALTWLAKTYCNTELHIKDKDMPIFSSGWFTGFKKRFNLRGYKMHGEAASMLTINQESVQNQINIVQEQLRNYELKNIFNFDETAIYYARSPVKTISPESVSGVKLDKKRLTVGLLCNADGTYRMNPCIIGRHEKPLCFKRQTSIYYKDTN
jgi:hypothetical protein